MVKVNISMQQTVAEKSLGKSTSRDYFLIKMKELNLQTTGIISLQKYYN